MDENPQISKQHKRRRDLDVMGNFVVVGLVFFHAASIFSRYGFFVKDVPSNTLEISDLVASTFIYFASLWGMPLMFLISGMAIWYSLRIRTAAEFTRDRIRRLLIPFVMGMMFFTPLNHYIILKHQSPHEASTYLQFLRKFFDLEFEFDSPLFINGASDLFSLSHMWFLIYLFGFTLLLLPLFLYLRQPAGQRLVDRVTTFFTQRKAIYQMGLPLAAIQVVLGPPNVEFSSTWNLWTYLLFLIYGYLFAADARFERMVYRQRRSALGLGILGFLILLGGFYFLSAVSGILRGTYLELGYVFLRFIQGMTGWCWLVAILGMVGAVCRKRAENPGGQPHLQQPDLASLSKEPPLKERLLAYAGEAQLPFYILHMTPIVIIGYFVVQWEVGALVKYIVIVLASLIGTLLLYDIGVKRTRLTRFLFGLKPGTPQQKQTVPKASLFKSQIPGS